MPNKKIKVSEATVGQLRKGTMAGNLAKAKNATKQQREALVRFYGAKRVNDAIAKATTPSPGPGGRMAAKPKGGPGAKNASMKPKASATKTNTVRVGNKIVNKPVNKPLIDLPAKMRSAQSKSTANAAATKALLDKQKKAAQARRDGMKY